MWKNQKGMTLVEIIVVIAVAAILMGTSMVMYNQIRYANTKRVVEKVDSALSELRVTTMSREGRQYLYIYQLSDGYYIKLLEDGSVTEVGQTGKLDGNGTRLCGSNAEIRRDDGTVVAGDAFIRVVYTKGGQFGDGAEGTNTGSIQIRGRGTFTIHLVKETGRHYVD